MYCENCGVEYVKGADFCEKCGNDLSRPGLIDRIFHDSTTSGIICPNCRNGEYNKNYCVKCGYNLKDVLGYYQPQGFLADDEYYLELNENYLKVQRNIRSEYDDVWSEFCFLYDKIETFQICSCSGRLFTGTCLKLTYNEDLKWESYPLKHFCDGKNSIKIPINDEYATEINNILKSKLQHLN